MICQFQGYISAFRGILLESSVLPSQNWGECPHQRFWLHPNPTSKINQHQRDRGPLSLKYAGENTVYVPVHACDMCGSQAVPYVYIVALALLVQGTFTEH